ncbi:nicotinamide-nucleotide amidase [Solemya elarraichensis gill symbiont]|uniref:Damage-inducible protein CinA n=1 Tax=Solemya elarraichensis gill symbiont TaxID=1918949 RepID=A0A1T2L862_9GAMM|nr:nicotinamide-nucleotide amidase [Solemya elarraichensis gill symbiont]OOZ41298.1 damage-inducible protein CinA [Solemya elarraichensis gill symbiont]
MNNFELKCTQLVEQLAEILRAQQRMLVTAETCTGGWIAKSCTDITGSSAWFERGFVTYTNNAKQQMLGVSAATLEANGAVSEAVVAEMVTGAMMHSPADLAVAVSGIAGPGGGSEEKPVGTVCFAWASGKKIFTAREQFDGDRDAIRKTAVLHALEGLIRHAFD